MPALRIVAQAVTIAISLLLAGCERAWNDSNRETLHADAGSLLRSGGITPKALACRMAGTTRDATCTFEATPSQVETLAHALALNSFLSSSDPASPFALALARTPRLCLAASPDLPPDVRLWGIFGRPPSLRLPNGSAFEYLLLFHNATTDEVCIQISYAYG